MEANSYFIQTFGCQMNERESETLAGMLEERGYHPVSQRSKAQIVIFNTCSVRDNADKRFIGTLGQIKKQRLENPDMIVAVCGCLTQQPHMVEIIRKKYSWVDIIFGTHNVAEFPELLDKAQKEKCHPVSVEQIGGPIAEGLPVRRRYPFKAYVCIMNGCNNFCSYCIVPYTRGRERSRTPEAVLEEVRTLAENGCSEIMLLGQNVNSYKGVSTESGQTWDFPRLIYALQEVEGIQRIRFMTSHPKDLSPRLIRAYVDCPKLCRHIHLPVQSGSTEILRQMNRRYSKEGYLDLVASLRKSVPDIAITTDIIVGFPGETEEDFQETLDLVEKVRYDAAFTFLYSPRMGTPAAAREDQIPEEVKHERFDRLVELVNRIAAENNLACVGKTLPVMGEGKSKTDLKKQCGRTEDHRLVNFMAAENCAGKTVMVKIHSANTFSLEGTLAE